MYNIYHNSFISRAVFFLALFVWILAGFKMLGPLKLQKFFYFQRFGCPATVWNLKSDMRPSKTAFRIEPTAHVKFWLCAFSFLHSGTDLCANATNFGWLTIALSKFTIAKMLCAKALRCGNVAVVWHACFYWVSGLPACKKFIYVLFGGALSDMQKY